MDELTDFVAKSKVCSRCGIDIIHPWHQFAQVGDSELTTTVIVCEPCSNIETCYYCEKESSDCLFGKVPSEEHDMICVCPNCVDRYYKETKELN